MPKNFIIVSPLLSKVQVVWEEPDSAAVRYRLSLWGRRWFRESIDRPGTPSTLLIGHQFAPVVAARDRLTLSGNNSAHRVNVDAVAATVRDEDVQDRAESGRNGARPAGGLAHPKLFDHHRVISQRPIGEVRQIVAMPRGRSLGDRDLIGAEEPVVTGADNLKAIWIGIRRIGIRCFDQVGPSCAPR